MPNLNGLELFARIREIDPTAKALLLTLQQFTEGGLRVGQDYLRVITKPISNEKLLAEIDYTLNRPVNSSASSSSTLLIEHLNLS